MEVIYTGNNYFLFTSKSLYRFDSAAKSFVWNLDLKFGQSKPDFINKLSIALKEANETEYWLLLLKDTNFMDEISYKSIADNCQCGAGK